MSFMRLASVSSGPPARSGSDRLRALCDVPEGTRGVVAVVGRDEKARLDRLLALGVTPGASVTVLQTFPGVVFLCDQTELAVERDVAAAILIRLLEE